MQGEDEGDWVTLQATDVVDEVICMLNRCVGAMLLVYLIKHVYVNLHFCKGES